MQLVLDFLPIVAFFVAYKFAGIFTATGVLIAAVLLQTAWQWTKHRKVSPMSLISATLVLVFGGITLILHNKTFIQWKPTVLYWLFAAGLLASQFFGSRPLIQRVMGENLQLERPLWLKLNLLWVIFFIVLGAINLYVVYSYDEQTWVNFKLFGLLGLTMAFALIQGFWLSTKMPPDPPGDSSNP